jgi:hypothetical protein
MRCSACRETLKVVYKELPTERFCNCTAEFALPRVKIIREKNLEKLNTPVTAKAKAKLFREIYELDIEPTEFIKLKFILSKHLNEKYTKIINI